MDVIRISRHGGRVAPRVLSTFLNYSVLYFRYRGGVASSRVR